MIHLIPKPAELKTGTGIVSFSRNTEFSGDFSELYPVLVSMLPPVSGEANRLVFEKDSAVAREGYQIRCENGDLFVTASDASCAF